MTLLRLFYSTFDTPSVGGRAACFINLNDSRRRLELPQHTCRLRSWENSARFYVSFQRRRGEVTDVASMTNIEAIGFAARRLNSEKVSKSPIEATNNASGMMSAIINGVVTATKSHEYHDLIIYIDVVTKILSETSSIATHSRLRLPLYAALLYFGASSSRRKYEVVASMPSTFVVVAAVFSWNYSSMSRNKIPSPPKIESHRAVVDKII